MRNATFKKFFITSIMAFGVSAVPAQADQAEAQFYANLEAFQTTDASRGLSCATMIRQVNTMASVPYLKHDPRMASVLALDAGQCLQAVRRETADALPTQLPRAILVEACRRSRIGDPADYKAYAAAYCAIAGYKPGEHLLAPNTMQ